MPVLVCRKSYDANLCVLISLQLCEKKRLRSRKDSQGAKAQRFTIDHSLFTLFDF